MTYTFRPATADDAPQLAVLLKAIGWFISLEELSIKDLETLLRNQMHALVESPVTTTIVATDEDRNLLGYCNVHWLIDLFMPGPEGYLSELFILPKARGQGLGKSFLEQIVDEAKTRGAYRLSLLNSKHRESYERAFYQKNGWVERPHMANFIYLIDQSREHVN